MLLQLELATISAVRDHQGTDFFVSRFNTASGMSTQELSGICRLNLDGAVQFTICTYQNG